MTNIEMLKKTKGIFLNKKCFFCNAELTKINLKDIEDKEISSWIEENYGNTKKFHNKIGSKFICRDCALDIRFIV